MMLNSIEINGFKSFAKKSKLFFDSPVTSVVGPNGSGKSNIAESFRFVLGEQSMKSLRGKSLADLIFAGSKNIGKLNRATVSISFDNKDKVFSFQTTKDKEIKLDYDEVIISREVYSDGASSYFINGSEVRLKDVIELLASINIGSSGHHIISQGEADRILSASLKERKEMIEDSLGLKVYQYRLKDSERKLTKTKDNIREVEILRKEIAPHIQFLKKQVEKHLKAEDLKKELAIIYKEYLKIEEVYLEKEQARIGEEKEKLTNELGGVEENLRETDISLGQNVDPRREELRLIDDKVREIRVLKDNLTRSLGRIEGIIELEESKIKNWKGSITKEESIVISRDELKSVFSDLNNYLDSALINHNFEEIREILSKIKKLANDFLNKNVGAPEEKDLILNIADIENMKKERGAILEKINEIDREEKGFYNTSISIKEEIEKDSQAEREKERRRFEFRSRKSELVNTLNILKIKEDNLMEKNRFFEESLKEAGFLIGPEVLSFRNLGISEDGISTQDERKRRIERIKIKLEDIGVGDYSDVAKEHSDALERDAFLAKEIEDLKNSMDSLQVLIKELKDKIENDFKIGIEKINTQFGTFFQLMFDGGSAYLALVKIEKRKKEEELEGEEIITLDEDEAREEYGIEIGVSLPKKKIRDLAMLSGGERSLTSIALLFAISQVNPPPFLILDETDAALDEANSKKYGDMLENLSKKSQLIVITHNRETMSRANILYGVTIGNDGSSRVLSVKFDEAVAIAK